jgi:SAM-dependent methyltransferase
MSDIVEPYIPVFAQFDRRRGKKVTQKTLPFAMNHAQVQLAEGGGIHFSSSDRPGAGIFYFELDRLHEAPVFFRLNYRLCSGQFYATLVDRDWQVISPTPQSQGDSGAIHLYVERFLPGLKIMVGVQAIGVRGKITAISTLPHSSISAADAKRLRGQEFPFWYAEADLGDGVFMPASIPAASMASTRRSYAIMRTMLEELIGPLAGKRGIDVGCSSGFHTIQLARLGADMTGIDPFNHGIRQARFVAECNRDSFHTPPQFACESLYDYEAAEPFDFIYCVGVLYHLADPIGAVRRLYRLCKLGGVIGCCVSPTPGDFFELSNAEKYGFCQPTEFTLVPTAGALRRVCEHVGFRVLKVADWTEFEGEPGPTSALPGAPRGDAVATSKDDQSVSLRFVPKEIDVPIGPVYYALAK